MKALAQAFVAKLLIEEIRNDVTRKPGGTASGETESQCRGKEEILHRQIYQDVYLQITALVLEILQTLVVQFLVVCHGSVSGCSRYDESSGFSFLARLVSFSLFSQPCVRRLFSAAESAVHTGNAGGGGQPSSGVEEGWGNPLHSHWSVQAPRRIGLTVGHLIPLLFPAPILDMNVCAFDVMMIMQSL